MMPKSHWWRMEENIPVMRWNLSMTGKRGKNDKIMEVINGK
jgi:hypothetical protein